MIAVLGGLGAACCWATTGIFAQRATRAIGEAGAFAWAAVIGLALVITPACATALATHITGTTAAELAVAGALNVLGLVAQFSALVHGRVSMILPIASAEGAVAALVAAAAGARLGTVGWLSLAAVVVGVLINALEGRSEDRDATGNATRDVGLAVFAALAFGCGLYLQGHASAHAPLGLAIAPPSAMGALLVAAPLKAAGRLPSPRPAMFALPAVAVAELLGFLSYVVGARHSLPVAAVLSSQYATIAVILGIAVLKERPKLRQLIGYVMIVVGVAVISAYH